MLQAPKRRTAGGTAWIPLRMARAQAANQAVVRASKSIERAVHEELESRLL